MIDVQPIHRTVIHEEPVAMPRARIAIANGRAHGYTPRAAAEAKYRLRRRLEEWWEGPPLAGPVFVHLTAHLWMPVGTARKHRETLLPTRRPDVDNCWRIWDCATGLLWADDAQIVDLCIRKRYAAYGETGYWVVEIGTLTDG